MDGGGDEERQGVGPGEGHVLLPPPLHHDGHVEAKHEGQRDEVAEVLAVHGHLLKESFLFLTQCEPVCQVTGVIQATVSEQLRPHQFVDASFPSEKKLPEAAKAAAGGHIAGVGDRHGEGSGGKAEEVQVLTAWCSSRRH